LIWLFVLSMIIVRREEGDLRWATVKRRLRLNTPRDPKTGETRRKSWLSVIPFVIGITVWEPALTSYLDDLWVSLFPFFAEPPGYGLGAILESRETLDRLVGAGGSLPCLWRTPSSIRFWERSFSFGVYSCREWGACLAGGAGSLNGMLFGFYHLHQPWGIPRSVISGVFLYTFPSWRFRSTWMGIIVDSAQSAYFALLIFGVVLDLA
jgi:hypothetical protein